MRVSLLAAFSWLAGYSSAFAIEPPAALVAKGGLTHAMCDGGVASVADLSAVENNPAAIAVVREFSLGGEFAWVDKNAVYSEVGARDSSQSNSPLSAAFKMRRSTAITGGRHTRYSLGIAERYENSPLIFGGGGDYEQFKEEGGFKEKETNMRIRGGVLWEMYRSDGQVLLAGVRAEGFTDKYFKDQYAAGLAANLGTFYSFNADLLYSEGKSRKYTGGVTVAAQQYLDLYISYGYNTTPQRHEGAAGLLIKSQKVKLQYVVSKRNIYEAQMQHQIGLSFTSFIEGT